MFGPINRWRIGHFAQEHARLGVYRADAAVVQLLGSRPSFDPERYDEHGRWLQDQTGTRLNDLREVTAEREQATAAGNHFPPFVITAGIIFAVLVESVGGAYLMAGFGMADAHRVLFGIAFGLGLLLFTAVVAKAPTPAQGGNNVRSSLGRVFVLLGYTGVICAVVALRIADASEDDNRLQAIAEAIIMLVATAGPPWGTEFLMRRRSASRVLHTELRQLRGEMRDATRDQRTARRSMRELSREGERWDRESRRLSDIYTTEFSLARARLDLPPLGESAPSDGPAYRAAPTGTFERRLP